MSDKPMVLVTDEEIATMIGAVPFTPDPYLDAHNRAVCRMVRDRYETALASLRAENERLMAAETRWVTTEEWKKLQYDEDGNQVYEDVNACPGPGLWLIAPMTIPKPATREREENG